MSSDRLNLLLDFLAVQTYCGVLLFAVSLNAATLTVKSGGGGNYTTIQACASAMAAGDTCTVYAGTYGETVTIPAGATGSYKTLNVNGSDVVYVQGFVAASYTKIIGFHIQYPSSPGYGCISIENGTQYLYIRNNVLSECLVSGLTMINSPYPNTASYVFIQGNTLSYGGVQSGVGVNTTLTAGFSSGASSISVASVGGAQKGWTVYGAGIDVSGGTFVSSINGTTVNLTRNTSGTGTNGEEISLYPPVSNSIYATGDHWLIENNDFSHYTLSILFLTKYSIFRNNSFHDQNQYEAGGNTHTDTFFVQPGVPVPIQYNVMEGNYQSNALGPDAKGLLAQNESCGGTCYNIIERFNTMSRVGGGNTSNNADPGWPYFKVYNNTYVDPQSDITSSNPVTDNHTYGGAQTSGAPNASELNNLFYYSSTSGGVTTGWTPYSMGTVPTDVYGYNLVFCPHCSTIYNHQYGGPGTWLSDPGNLNADPKFVNYVSPGSSSNNYHLQPGSLAIARGTYLTTVASSDSGSGTSLVVNDASYFQDGYGLSNEYSTVNPDCIAVGTSSTHVCITAVNYTTNTLTLASSITRSAAQGVYLYSKSDGVQVLTGTAPDIGAYPYTGGPSNNPPPAPTALTAVPR
jgi:hypothetical protein